MISFQNRMSRIEISNFKMEHRTETDSTLKDHVNDILEALNSLPNDEDFHVTRTDILFIFISIVSKVIGMVTTLLLALIYYHNNKIDHFTWTLCCFIIPMFVTMFLQLSIYFDGRKDGEPKLNFFDICWSVIISPIIFRYWKTMVYTIKCKMAETRNDKQIQKKWFDRLTNEDSDVALVRVFECFLEAAPQKILQISIILSGEEDITVAQTLSLCSSIFSMAWCIASYHRCIRLTQIDKINISWIGSIVQSTWHLTITISRILSIAIVASLFPIWTLLSFSIHAIVMGLWVFMYDRSPFCADNWFHSLLFSLILGFVFIFNYILPRARKKTISRFAIFYTICFVENIVCVILYVYFSSAETKEENYFLPLCVLSIVPFIVGISFLILYYKRYHPNVVSRRKYKERDLQTISPATESGIPMVA